MNRTETLKIMAVLQAAYPQFYAKKTLDELSDIANLWTEMFSEEPYQLVAMAVKALIKTRVSTFPPGIGEINEKILKISQPEEMTEMEAWSLVKSSLRNSGYGSREEFEKLPATVQRIVGSPSALFEWSQMDSETVNSVIASNFQRSYRARAKNEREMLAMPSSVRAYMDTLAAGMASNIKQIEGGSTYEH